MVKMYVLTGLSLSHCDSDTHTFYFKFAVAKRWQVRDDNQAADSGLATGVFKSALHWPNEHSQSYLPRHTHTHNSTGQECADKKPRPFALSFSFILSLTELWWCLLKNLKTLQPFLIIKCWQFGIKILNRTKPSILKNECWIFML